MVLGTDKTKLLMDRASNNENLFLKFLEVSLSVGEDVCNQELKSLQSLGVPTEDTNLGGFVGSVES